jgi:hypothetical protein
LFVVDPGDCVSVALTRDPARTYAHRSRHSCSGFVNLPAFVRVPGHGGHRCQHHHHRRGQRCGCLCRFQRQDAVVLQLRLPAPRRPRHHAEHPAAGDPHGPAVHLCACRLVRRQRHSACGPCLCHPCVRLLCE